MSEESRISHEQLMAAFADLNRMVERQHQNGQAPAQSVAQR